MSRQWWQEPVAVLNGQAMQQACQRQQQLTKPAGSLGELESLAIQLAGMQHAGKPELERIWISLFAADHGVVAEGISAFPQAVTGQMLRNFAAGGAAISVLARQLNAPLKLVNLGLVTDMEVLPGVQQMKIAPGTANLLHQPAMSPAQCRQALQAGRDQVYSAYRQRAQLFVGGEMGIGNTTSACALACALLGQEPALLVGPGTGLDSTGVEHKRRVIEAALTLHQIGADNPLRALECLGGLEIAALTGSYLAAAQLGLPVLVDGYITTVAALCAVCLNPGTRDWLLFSHSGAEPGHQHILQALDARPLLNLGLRLGEGSGAALAVPLLQAACALHGQMATFDEASVSGAGA